MTANTDLRTGKRVSLHEFLALGDADGRELDDGVLYIISSGTRAHQFLGLELCRRILDYIDSFEQPPADIFRHRRRPPRDGE